jgi:aspartate racemase
MNKNNTNYRVGVAPRHIGLVGGIGPAATDYYYRRLIVGFAAAGVPLTLTIAHADAPTLLANLAAGAVVEQAAIYQRLADRLAAAGADCIAITSIAGHFCIDRFAPLSPLPVVDMISTITAAVRAQRFGRIGILGTRTVMASRLYGVDTGAVIVPPAGAAFDAVHDAYAAMAAAGTVTDAQRQVFDAASAELLATGCEAILLGGTDLALVYQPGSSRFPIIDCAGIHADAIMRHALGHREIDG